MAGSVDSPAMVAAGQSLRPGRLLNVATALIAGLIVIQDTGAMAQATRSVDPGVVPRQFERPLTPQARPPVVVPEIQRPQLPAGAGEVEFVLKEIRLDGNEVLSDEALQPQWSRYIGQSIRLTDVFEIAAAITVFYRNEGYILSRAIVPPQEIENGVVEIEILEGFVDNVVIEGEPSGSMAQFDHKIEQIKASRPLNIKTIERYMLLINDLPGVSATSLLRPSPTTPGASELVIVLEETTLSASASFDNRGTRFVGPFQQILTANLSNVLGLYESTEIRAIRAQNLDLSENHRELRFGSVRHSELLTAEGTILDLNLSRTLTSPGPTLDALGIEGRATQAAISLTHPVIRSRSENLSVQLGFNYLDSITENTRPDAVIASDDRTRWFSLVASGDFVDRFRGVNLLRLEAQQGVNIFGARESESPLLTRANGRSTFTKVNLDVIREQDIAVGWTLLAGLTAQWTPDELLAAQEFGFGGRDYGRGYDPSEISGDRGVAGRLELRFGRAAALDYLETYQLFGFYDYGAVFRIDTSRLPGGRRDTASSAGFGVRLNFTPDLFSSVEMAHPLTRPPALYRDDGKKEPRVFFRVTGRI